MTSGLSKQQLLLVVLIVSACKLSVRHIDVRFRHCKCRCSPRANGSPLQASDVSENKTTSLQCCDGTSVISLMSDRQTEAQNENKMWQGSLRVS